MIRFIRACWCAVAFVALVPLAACGSGGPDTRDDIKAFVAAWGADTLTAALEGKPDAVALARAPGAVYCSTFAAADRSSLRSAFSGAFEIRCEYAPGDSDLVAGLPSYQALLIRGAQRMLISRLRAALEGDGAAIKAIGRAMSPYCSTFTDDQRERLRLVLGNLYVVRCDQIAGLFNST